MLKNSKQVQFLRRKKIQTNPITSLEFKIGLNRSEATTTFEHNDRRGLETASKFIHPFLAKPTSYTHIAIAVTKEVIPSPRHDV